VWEVLVTYYVKPDATTAADGKQEVTNNATAHDINHWPSASTTTVLQNSLITKTSEKDDTNKKIKWTIIVKNSNPRHDMSKDTFKDILTEDGTPVSLPSTIYVDHNGTKVPITVAADGSFKLPTSVNGQGYGWYGDSYTITYETDYPTGPQGTQKDVSNKIEYTPNGGSTYTSGSSQWIAGEEKNYGVNKWDATVTSSDDKKATLNWWAAILLPEGTITKDSIEYKDTLTTSGTDESGKHYTTPKLLQDMYLYPTTSDNKSGDTLVKGTDYRVYDPTGNDITDSNSEDPITGFKIKFTDDGLAKVQGTKQININYSSVADYESQDNKTTWNFKNTGSIPGYSHDGKWDHNKDYVINKMSSSVGPGFINYGSGNYNYKDTGIVVEKKDGIIYYAVVVKVPEGTTGDMTLTDTFPSGLSYKKDSVSIAIYGSNDDATRNYTDGQGVLGVTVSDPSTVTDENGNTIGTSVKFSITGYRPGKSFILYYQAEVKDDGFWSIQTNTDKDYTNKIEWNTYHDSTTTHVEQNKNVIEKEGASKKNEDGTWNLTYHLKVNPTAEDLDPNSDQLTLTDTLTIPSDSDAKAYFDPSTIHVYQFDADMPYGMGSEISSSRYTYQYDEQTHKITVTIPDQLACVVTYQYNATVGINDTTISNTAELKGVANSSTKDDQKLTGSTSSATTSQNKMVVYKVDSNDDKIKLSGVTFKLEEYKGKSNNQEVWEQIEFKDSKGNSKGNSKTTDVNGQITFTTIDDGLKENTLYRIVETDVGNNPGYVLNTTPSYFIWKTNPLEYTKSDGTKVTIDKPRIDHYANWFNDNGLGWPNSVQQSEVYLVDGQGSVNYPNVKQAITVNKIWLNADNKDLNDSTKTATVALYRKYTQSYTETTQLETVNVRVHMKDISAANAGHTDKDVIIKTIQVVKNNADAKVFIQGVSSLDVAYQNSSGGTGSTLDKGTLLHDNGWNEENVYYIPVGSISQDTDYYLISDNHNEWDPWNSHVTLYTTPSSTQTTSGTRDVDERAADASGKVYPEVTLTSSTNWSYLWTDLPDKNSAGNTYYYYVKETAVDGKESNLSDYDTTVTNNGGIEKGTITVTNKSKTQVQHAEFNFTKQWIGEDGKTISTDWPKDIAVTLTGTSSGSTISDTFTIHRDENGSFTATKIPDKSTENGIATYSFAGSAGDGGFKLKFSDLPYADASGNVYTYTLKEENVEGYSAQYYGAEGNSLVTSGIVNGGIVKNVPTSGYVLPSTGGHGTIAYVVSGALLMAGALLLYIIRKRRNTPALSTDNGPPG